MRRLLCVLVSNILLCATLPALAQTGNSDYAGYVISWDGTHPMTQVSGCWTIPQIVLGTTVDPTHQFNYVAEWAGMGGINSNFTLSQTGSNQIISTASTYAQTYSGFYATGTGGNITISPGTYQPGDVMCASVNCTLNCVANTTTATIVFTQNDCPQTLPIAQCIAATTGSPGGTNWTYSGTVTNVHTDLKSVELIVEDVSYNTSGGLYPYPAYGFIPFRNMTCTEPGATGQCGGSTPQNPVLTSANEYYMANSTGNAYASAPVSTTDGGNVCYSASIAITCPNTAGLQNNGGDFTDGGF